MNTPDSVNNVPLKGRDPEKVSPSVCAELLEKEMVASTMGVSEATARQEDVSDGAIVKTARTVIRTYNAWATEEADKLHARRAELRDQLHEGAITENDFLGSMATLCDSPKQATLKPSRTFAHRFRARPCFTKDSVNTVGNYLSYDHPKMIEARAAFAHRRQETTCMHNHLAHVFKCGGVLGVS